MKRAIFLFLILVVCGCIKPPVVDEVIVLDIEPDIDYYSLGGHVGGTGEAFFVASGDAGEVKKILNEIVVGGGAAETTFTQDDALNFVVFRGVFSTGGYGISIDRVERAGSAFVVHATYTNPGEGMIVSQAFTQPVAIIPIGKLQKGRYQAKLRVTTISKDEDRDSIIGEDIEHASISFVVK
jgi:hypothetical protein